MTEKKAETLFDLGSQFDAAALEGVTEREAASAAKATRRIGKMHQKHGHGPEGARCGDCQHFGRKASNTRSYFKCALFGVSSSTATDWRMSWPACGKFYAATKE